MNNILDRVNRMLMAPINGFLFRMAPKCITHKLTRGPAGGGAVGLNALLGIDDEVYL